ncbi:hypothetical protein FOA52_015383 [Chlamydomonas sp. UWO 241]|nr:hypothetical protein FOA52_015383 [Chlamydomonas sp. UWO 241]
MILPADFDADLPTFALTGGEVKTVSAFKYLGSWITQSGGVEKEIGVRVGRALGVFASFDKIWASKKMQVRALKLLRVCPGFCSVCGCMLEGVVLWQHEQQQRQQQQQGERALSGSHTGATALALLARVLSLFGCENGHVPVSQRIWEIEDEAVRQQPSVRMPRFVHQGDFIMCRNQATRILSVLGALLEEVLAALQASSQPPPAEQLAEWERRLECILTTSPDRVTSPSDMKLDSREDGDSEDEEAEGSVGEEDVLGQDGEQQRGAAARRQDDDLRRQVALLMGSAPADPAPSSRAPTAPAQVAAAEQPAVEVNQHMSPPEQQQQQELRRGSRSSRVDVAPPPVPAQTHHSQPAFHGGTSTGCVPSAAAAAASEARRRSQPPTAAPGGCSPGPPVLTPHDEELLALVLGGLQLRGLEVDAWGSRNRH